MKLSKIKNLKSGDHIYGFYYCIYKFNKVSRHGDKYIDVLLKDNSGKIYGKLWDNVDYFNQNFNNNEIVAVKGDIIEFNSKLEINIKFINIADNNFYNDLNYKKNLTLK